MIECSEVFNMDPLIVCENQKIQCPRYVHLPEVPRCETHNQKIQSESDNPSENEVVIQLFVWEDMYLCT